MNKLILLMFFSTYLFAGVNPGDTIKANDFNNSSFRAGDVKISILTLSQFQSQHGDCWILMDGSSITGKDLATLTGQSTIPDARGVYVRGKNNARADGKQNPDGELAIGTYQSDLGRVTVPTSYANYAAGINANYLSNPSYLNPGSTNWQVYGSQTHGGNETRPRSITLNYFIKIHNTCN